MTRHQNEQAPKPQRLYFATYLAMVKNAPGTGMFRNFYLAQDGREFDAVGNGDNACAFFVSSVLVIFQKLERVHGTVDGTVQDLTNSGWLRVDEPAAGDALVWEARPQAGAQHRHIGFCIGPERAVSTSTSKKVVAEHDLHFGAENRRITAIYRHPSWS